MDPSQTTSSSDQPNSSAINLTDLSNQHIFSLRGFDDLQRHHRLTHLDLSGNPLRSLEHISSSNALVSLNLTGTDITSFFGTKPQPALRELFLKNTPISHSPLYRITSLLAFGPKLKSIDDVPVSSAERDAAFRFGADAAVAVSFGWVPQDTVERSADDYAKIVRTLHAERKSSSSSNNKNSASSLNNANNITLAAAVEKLISSQREKASRSVAITSASSSVPPTTNEKDHNINNTNNHDETSSVEKEVELLNANHVVRQDKDSEIAFLRARIKELEAKLNSSQEENKSEKNNKNSAGGAVVENQTPAATMTSANLLHAMKLPGLLPSEIDTLDSVTWCAPLSTIYSFVVDRNGGGSRNENSNNGDSSSSFQLPQTVAVTLSRHTIEIQKLMSRQAVFRQHLNQLVKVEAGEVGKSSSSSSASSSSSSGRGPFKTTSSIQLHFADGSSALLLFVSRTCMNAIFKSLKFRSKNLAKSISFSFDADLSSLSEFLAPCRTSDDLIDLFEQTTKQMQQLQQDMFKRSGSSSSPSAIVGLALNSSPLSTSGKSTTSNTNSNSNTQQQQQQQNSFLSAGVSSGNTKRNPQSLLPSPGSTSLSTPNWPNSNNRNNNNQQQQQLPPMGKPPRSDSTSIMKNSPQVTDRKTDSLSNVGSNNNINAMGNNNNESKTPSDFGMGDQQQQDTTKYLNNNNSNVQTAKPTGNDDDGNDSPIIAKTNQGGLKNITSNSDDSFDLGDDSNSNNNNKSQNEKADPKATKNKKRGDDSSSTSTSSSDEDDNENSDNQSKKSRATALRPGVGMFQMPTAVKVGGRITPSTTTPRITQTPQGDQQQQSSSTTSASNATAKPVTPVTIGNFKGKAIVVAKKKDSDDDSDSDDE